MPVTAAHRTTVLTTAPSPLIPSHPEPLHEEQEEGVNTCDQHTAPQRHAPAREQRDGDG